MTVEGTLKTLARGGVTLAYTDEGVGSPALVLIHGWCCDHTYMAPQAEYFSRSHRVISLDLRGHGASDRPQQAYSIESFADDVAWVCSQLDLDKPVVIGHSMGGSTALAVGANHPGAASGIVMLDAPLAVSAKSAAAMRPLVAAFSSENSVQALKDFAASQFFIDSDDLDRKAEIVAAMASASPWVAGPAFEAVIDFDATSALSRLTVPAMYVSAWPVLADAMRLRDVCPWIVTAATAGAGHFHQLEVPDQVNGMIERFLTTAVPEFADKAQSSR